MLKPLALRSGDRVAVLAPASPSTREAFEAGIVELRRLGFEPVYEPSVFDRDTYVAIGIGEPDFWSKGYGTDAMRVMLRYGFTELNLHRISLTVFEVNPRGIRSYEKCGFKHEGRIREFLLRDGKRSDMLLMGVLRSEWEQLQQE